MTRLLVNVEGQTEETFVNEILRPHLFSKGFASVSARLVGNARLRENRGGIKPWFSAREDIARHLKTDAGCYSTTMVDFYALPANGQKAWPGRDFANGLDHQQKAKWVEEQIAIDMANYLGNVQQSGRFIPYVVTHEFEALLFSDCTAFATGINRPELASEFQKIRDQFSNPEEINDSPQTAPSKRVEALVAGYQKPLLGNLAALQIGLHKMQAHCPRFAEWIGRLEALAPVA